VQILFHRILGRNYCGFMLYDDLLKSQHFKTEFKTNDNLKKLLDYIYNQV